jgi:glucose/arabinose dehydrogenase
MHTVTRVALACSTTLLLAGCAKTDKAASDSAAAAAAAAATPAPEPAPAPSLSLADVAGKWQMRSVPESGKDTSATPFVLTATADTTGWMMTFPTGVKSPLHVTASGDSLVVKSGEFSSQRRKNVKVTTETVYRLQGGKLTGTTIAHYAKAGPDSVLRLHSEGTKMP